MTKKTKIIKNPYKHILNVVVSFHEMAKKKLVVGTPNDITNIIEDYQEFCILIEQLKNSDLSIIEEMEDKRKITSHLDEMKLLIEKIKKMKAFW